MTAAEEPRIAASRNRKSSAIRELGLQLSTMTAGRVSAMISASHHCIPLHAAGDETHDVKGD
jgi:hypothetical protein